MPHAAADRAGKLPEKDALRTRLEKLSTDCSQLRTKIVATKEGGMITGEERIRELLGHLYEAVNRYEGRPTAYQIARTESLGHELGDVADEFRTLAQTNLSDLNAALGKKKLTPIAVLSEDDWKKKREEESGAGAAPATRTLPGRTREID